MAAVVVHIPLLSLHGIFEYEKGLLHLVNEFLCDSRWEFRIILNKSGDAEYAVCVLAYLPKLQALEEGPWFLSVVTGRAGGPVLGCLEANRAFSLEPCFRTLSVRFKTLKKEVVVQCEQSEEDTQRRIDCLGHTDYEIAEAKAKHPPNKHGRRGTSLHVAVRANDLASVKMFIRCGEFDVGATDNDGETPLHWAADNTNNPAIIHAIVQAPHGLDVLNTRGSVYGLTPLLLAAVNNRPRVIEALVSTRSMSR